MEINVLLFDRLLGSFNPENTAAELEVPAAGNKKCAENAPQVVLQGTSQDIYQRWIDLQSIAVAKQNECRAQADLLEVELEAAELAMAKCYEENTKLKARETEISAHLQSQEEHFQKVQEELAQYNSRVQQLNDKINKLQNDKAVFDALRWIPVVGGISEFVAAITGTRNDLQRAQHEQNRLRSASTTLDGEINRCKKEINTCRQQMQANMQQIAHFNALIASGQARRASAKQELLQWTDRAVYCAMICEKIENLIRLEADPAELEQLLLDNPPPFALAA